MHIHMYSIYTFVNVSVVVNTLSACLEIRNHCIDHVDDDCHAQLGMHLKGCQKRVGLVTSENRSGHWRAEILALPLQGSSTAVLCMFVQALSRAGVVKCHSTSEGPSLWPLRI